MIQRNRTIAATIGVAVLALGGTACSGSDSDGAAPSGAAVSSIGADQLTTGTASGDLDAVTWYGGYRPVITLDPIGLADYPEETAIPNMCEPLMKVTPDYGLEPGLATKGAYTDDTHYVITIRTDVTFWDGKPMTAEDVAYSLGRNLDPTYASNYSGAFAQVTGVKATGDDTVTVTLKQRSRSFEQALGTLGAAVVEKAFAEKAGRAFGSPSTGVMCTGPFEFQSYDGTSRLVMKKNPDYWDADGAAHASTFTFVYPTDPAALANGLESGKIDGALSLPSTLADQLQDSSAGTLYVGQEGSTPINVDLLFTAADGPSADPKVRQALSTAIDRAGIAKTVFAGTADPLYKVSGPGVWGYATSTYDDAYQDFVADADPEAATKLLAEAGVADQQITFGYPAGDAESEQVATVVQQEAQQIGLDIKLVGIPNQQYGALFADPSAREPYDLILTKNYIELPEPMNLDALVGSDAGNMNFSGYHDDAVEQALAEADRTEDDDARAELVVGAEAKLADALPVIPIAQPRALVFEGSKVTGSTLTFSFMTSPWAAAVGAK
ncbi:ABC transporter substrate-binding protein [Nocardioides mangrovi]|uniref:ABC transporter substrate-binding protein n=1 Tax=Nocardioides mangrovi TaxID=2874580 RepID=A0ABS7U806_9ACTN|nr:ABC transporter substrate-binding protein [Nocardioides mangrovi]MBZ5737095.1 ABC transporter substrate-binding protein [Nocardioides mangrovi]